MAIVIPFEDIVRARRQRRERESLERCVDLLRLNIDFIGQLLIDCDERDRPIQVQRLERLTELLTYAESLV